LFESREGYIGTAGELAIHHRLAYMCCRIYRLGRPTLEERLRFGLDRHGNHHPELDVLCWGFIGDLRPRAIGPCRSIRQGESVALRGGIFRNGQ